MNIFQANSDAVYQRYKQKKLFMADRFMIEFLKIYTIVPFAYLLLDFIVDFSSVNYVR